MWAHISKWTKDIFSEDDGMSVCVAKVLAVISVLAFIAYAVYGLIAHDHFSISEFGTGLMTVLGGSGGIIAAKQVTQKSP
jgi:hypothetical protein